MNIDVDGMNIETIRESPIQNKEQELLIKNISDAANTLAMLIKQNENIFSTIALRHLEGAVEVAVWGVLQERKE
jgi:hypothetical protein